MKKYEKPSVEIIKIENTDNIAVNTLSNYDHTKLVKSEDKKINMITY